MSFFFRLFLTWHWAGFVTQSWQLCCWINYKGIITLHVTKSLFFLCKGPSSEACLLPRNSAPPVAALPRKGSIKLAASGVQVPSKPAPASPVRLPKDCHRSLGDLKVSQKILDGRAVSWQIWMAVQSAHSPISFHFLQVTRVLVARFLQRSKRNLAPSSEHGGSTGQGPKRRSGTEGANHLPLEQVGQQVRIQLSYFPLQQTFCPFDTTC